MYQQVSSTIALKGMLNFIFTSPNLCYFHLTQCDVSRRMGQPWDKQHLLTWNIQWLLWQVFRRKCWSLFCCRCMCGNGYHWRCGKCRYNHTCTSNTWYPETVNKDGCTNAVDVSEDLKTHPHMSFRVKFTMCATKSPKHSTAKATSGILIIFT